MYLPDISVLIHAHNLDSPIHEAARAWWDELLVGPTGVGLAWVVLLGFVRITTHRRVLAHPLAVAEAVARIRSWLRQPHFHIPEPSAKHFDRLAEQLERLGSGGNLTTDAHLATLAMERGYVLVSTDNDFERFRGLRWINPFAQTGI
jgi:toxin-antitoxin system PIN domain toxin